MRKTLIGAAAVALGLAGLAVSATPASAAVQKVWAPCATTNISDNRPNASDCTASAVKIMADNKVEFTGPATANIEAMELKVTLKKDDVISFEYNGACSAGSPRVYVTIAGTVYSTGDSCGTGDGDWKTVTYKVPVAGTLENATTGGWDVAAAGVVSDGGAEGTVAIRDVNIGDHVVNFNATTGSDVIKAEPVAPKIGTVDCEGVEVLTPDNDYPVAEYTVGDAADGKVKVTATAKKGYVLVGDNVEDGVATWTLTYKEPTNCESPSPKPKPSSPKPTTSPSTVAPVPSQSTSNTGAQLPVTGPGGGTNVPLIAALAGVALIGFGGAGLAWARRRRDNVEFTA